MGGGCAWRGGRGAGCACWRIGVPGGSERGRDRGRGWWSELVVGLVVLDDFFGEAAVGFDEVAAEQVEALAELAALADDPAGKVPEPSGPELLGLFLALFVEEPADGGAQAGQIEGLGEEVADAEAHGFDGTAEGGVGGDEDDGGVVDVVELADEVEGVGVGQEQVGQEQVVGVGQVELEGVGGGVGEGDFGGDGSGQVIGEHGGQVVVVFDDEDSWEGVGHGRDLVGGR